MVIRNTYDLWSFLKKTGGLDTKFYDVSIVEELKLRLSVPSEDDFEELLKTQSIAIEDFILAFFRAIQPYADMMTDLLIMFEKAGAKQTNNNLDISFKFEENQPELSFNLSHFRDYLETWKSITSTYLVNQWDYQKLWKLHSILRENDPEIINPDVERWLNEYMEQQVWPSFLLPAPQTGDSQLDEILARVWSIWTSVVQASSGYGNQRSALRDIQSQSIQRTDASSNVSDEEQSEDWSPEFLALVDSDHWAGSLAKGAYHKAEAIMNLPANERSETARHLQTNLDELFDDVGKVQVDRELLVRQLEEFLKLPIWQKRHELYSAWISTQLLNTLEDNSVRIHQIDGTLSFAFSGTHLATVDNFEPRLHLWAELRSPLANPVGKSRKKAIQPDYSLITDPVTSPNASILEVECKQYRKASTSNFANALTDYAKGRPNALVILVNYGKAKETILERVDSNVRDRTHIIGEMRPRSKTSLERFKQLVKEAIARRYGSTLDNAEGQKSINLTSKAQICLSWKNPPSDLDLDLHLQITKLGKTYEVKYSEKSIPDEVNPWAVLDRDIQSGNGTETIQIFQWVKGKYHCAIHNYSKEASLANCGACVTFFDGKEQQQFHCPKEGQGDWWSVFSVDGNTGELEVINKIVQFPW